MTFFNMDIKEMFVNGMNFAISNYDQRVYYRHDDRGTIKVACAVDDFAILALTPSLQQWTIEEIKKIHPDKTIQLELDTLLELEVCRDRVKPTVTLKQEGSIIV